MNFKFLLVLLIAQSCLTSQILQQQDLTLTIYSNGLALVTDTRKFSFDQGQSQLNFTDIPSSIKPQTVMFTPTNNNSSKITILQQTFQNGAPYPFAILFQLIDKDITLELPQGDNVRLVSGKLLSVGELNSEVEVAVQDATGVSLYKRVSAVRVRGRPEEILTKPMLMWRVVSEYAGVGSCVVGYRASRIEWRADYLVNLREEENKADLSGWVTINNNSGKKFVNARIKLIAGEMKIIPEQGPSFYGGTSNPVNSFSGGESFTLPHPVTLNSASKKQIEFIPKIYNISFTKTYEYDVPNLYTGVFDNIKFETTYNFLNSKWNKLGIPLPAGTLGLYKTNQTDKMLEFISEIPVSSTPNDEKVVVKAGTAADLVGRIFYEEMILTVGLGNYRVKFNITNRGVKPAPVVLNKNYSDTENYYITQNPGYSGPRWKRVSSTKYEMLTTIPANWTQIIEWNYTNKS